MDLSHRIPQELHLQDDVLQDDADKKIFARNVVHRRISYIGKGDLEYDSS